MPLPPDEDKRSKHPYHTHDMILEQPSALHTTLATCKKEAPEFTSYFSGMNQFVLTGCGTSYHAALACSYLLNALFLKTYTRPLQSFELIHYFRHLDSRTLVTAFSHTGDTKITIDALRWAKENGSMTIALTAVGDSKIRAVANKTLIVGNGKEKSRAHTKAYTTSLLASMYLSAGFIASKASNSIAGSLLEQLNDIPQSVSDTLRSEKEVVNLVNRWNDKVSRFFFVGAGPNYATALEGALKMKEENYSASEGMELEQFLHGPWVSLTRNSVVILIAPKGPSHQRSVDLLNACKKIGAPTIAVTDDRHIMELATDSIVMPEGNEELSPLTYIIPLQLFAYYMTLKKGVNPDYIHYDDPAVWDARDIIFPPGTH